MCKKYPRLYREPKLWLESIESIRNWLETTGPTDLEILSAFKLPF